MTTKDLVDELPPELIKKKIPFRTNYKDANCCGRLYYGYVRELIESVTANGGSMNEEMIEDMTLSEGET